MLKRLFLPYVCTFALLGDVCAANENVLYVQMTVDEVLVYQIDGVSPGDCKAVNNVVQNALKTTCSSESKESELPYTYTAKNVVSGETLIYRAKTLKGCELFNDESKNDKSTTNFVFTDCK